ncbi:DUF4331 domain-containing protein [Streptomyces pluripotens]|uniref:DUF4331 domain-containing protein n=1 Tax=Streptomyces pluripotens TaxID=1355015 RepID=A0A221NUU4_9ACTN|nr:MULTISPECIES: DUF4331 domain-containing protein [Streptomyces]ARP69477.1 hypothetical protein LK06_005415 [Streptomyces pluripotens]ASN23737.1 DUF4331 domain-containing protein [Streptomyces pluripotens]KIE27080.1 hypothetical protein LK08_10630 [Streptomyces sp. MUSC 125]MCH0555441.1 DUF4331 domain-containing protein [Streptomyces sp. MUM 16J]
MTPLFSRSGTGRTGLATLICGALAAGGLAAAGVATLEPGAASASSHREAPLISGAPQYDNTDLYAFVSPDKPDTTTIVANWIPFEEPAGGPNFYTFADDAQYDLHVDNNGDAREELIFRYTFKTHTRNKNTFLYNTGPVTNLADPDLNVTQTYDLDLIRLKNRHVVSKTKLADDAPVAPSNVGKASMPDYGKLRAQAVYKTAGGTTTFAGQADDPFFADLRVFDLLYGGNLSEVGRDTLKGYNVNTIALQVPNDLIRESAQQPVVGIWSTTQRRNAQGYYSQVSRLGNPLVNEVVNPQKDKDRFNASQPAYDAQFLKNVTEPELPKLIESIYKIKAPAEPRNDLVDVFLKGVKGLNQPPHVRPAEELRLNTAIKPSMHPKRLGVLDGDKAGFPNGRRLTDDVVDAALQVMEGELVGSKNDLGDAVNKNDRKFEKYFPYIAQPASGSRGPLAKGTTSGTDVRSQLGDALQPTGSSGSGSGDTMLIAASAASGAAAILLLGSAFAWWRRRVRRPY